MKDTNKPDRIFFTPLDMLIRIINHWWIVLAISLAGAAIGLATSLFIKPVYDSRFITAFSIDSRVTGELSDIEMDQVLSSAGDVFTSSTVMDAVIDAANEQGISITPSDVTSILFKERQYYNWIMRVRHTDPEISYQLTEIWLEESIRQIDSNLVHAEKASIIEKQKIILDNCLQEVAAGPAYAYCNLGNLDTIMGNINKVSQELMEERNASAGLLSGMSYSVIETPSLPVKPARFGKGGLILAGAVAGFFLALVFVNFIPTSGRKRNRL